MFWRCIYHISPSTNGYFLKLFFLACWKVMWVFFSSTYLPDPGRVGYTGLEYLPDTFNIKNQRKVGNMCHSDWIRHGIIVKSSIFLVALLISEKKDGPKKNSKSQTGWWFDRFFFNFHPGTWGNEPIWRAYFSDGLVQPPTSRPNLPPLKRN